MNENEIRAKNSIIKTLAIVGFIATMILAIWLSVQIIKFLPGTFSSLASIAGSISGYRPAGDLEVNLAKTIVSNDEPFTVSWTKMSAPGTVSFSYGCIDGVSITAFTDTGTNQQNLTCGVTTTLQQEVSELGLTISSEKQRFVDVPLSFSFVDDTNREKQFARSSKVTVVNASIPYANGTGTLSTTQLLTPKLGSNPENWPTIEADAPLIEVPEENVVIEEVVAPVVEETPVTTPTPIPAAQPAQVVSYIPQSYEDGFIDLKATYLGIGSYVDDRYVSTAAIDTDKRAAVKFEIKNIGTKTSGTWLFATELPSGARYTSDLQTALKPNERVEFTLGFTPDNEAGSSQFVTVVTTADDKNNANDSFAWTVQLTN